MTLPRRTTLWLVFLAVACFGIACASAAESESSALTPPTPQVQTAAETPLPGLTPEPVPTAITVPTRANTPEPTPAPTDTPEPAATPVPTDTSVPTPTKLSQSDFDLERFTTDVIESPPETLRVAVDTESPDGASAKTVFETRSKDGAFSVIFDISGDNVGLRIAIITIGNRTYLSGEIGGEAIDWITAEDTEPAENPLGAVAKVTSPEALGRQWIAVAVEPCRGELTCFVLEDPEESGLRLLVDTITYYPVTLTNSEAAEGEPANVEIDWNPDLEFAIPANAEEVTSDELGFALFGLILALGTIESDTTTPAAETTPEPVVEGGSRSAPIPLGGAIESNGFSIRVEEVIRSDEAWKILQETNQFNGPPGEGREYVLVHVAGTYSGDEDTDINQFYFRLTGDSSVAASPASLVEPDPQFPDAVTPGAEFESWISFDVKAGESSLLLIFQPSFTADDSANRFLALEPDASVTVDYDDLPVPTDAGRLRSAPVPIGETTIDTMWELTALDLIRGDAALALVREASPFSDDPAPGYEYAVVKVRARNVSRNPEAADISSYTLSLTGNENVLYGTALVADPAPALRYEVFPGGTVEGWAVYEIRQADTGLMVVRTELFAGFGNDDARYLALEDNAGVDPVGDPLAEPSDLGTDRESPVPSGEAAIAGAFEIQILNVFRGQEALDLIAEASVFNDPPEEGLEYVVVQLRVRNVSGEDRAVAVNEFSFKLIGESGESLDLPFVRNPQPDIDADLFPGGVHEGWIVLQTTEGEAGLTLVYKPFGFAGERYFALE